MLIKIKDNTFTVHGEKEKYTSSRTSKIENIFNALLKKYKMKDTFVYISLNDGYFHKDDLPVFSWSVPVGVKGLIFPNFDLLNCKI